MITRPDLWSSYIWPAYVLTIGALVVLLGWAFLSMRRAERRAEDLKRK